MPERVPSDVLHDSHLRGSRTNNVPHDGLAPIWLLAASSGTRENPIIRRSVTCVLPPRS
jgi:hypothetical protein